MKELEIFYRCSSAYNYCLININDNNLDYYDSLKLLKDEGLHSGLCHFIGNYLGEKIPGCIDTKSFIFYPPVFCQDLVHVKQSLNFRIEFINKQIQRLQNETTS